MSKCVSEKERRAVRGTREVAEAFWRARQVWMSDDGASGEERARREGAVDALAWALGVDLALMNAPVIGEGVVPPKHVRIRELRALGCFLVEVPGDPRPDYQTQFCAYFLSEPQMVELLGAALQVLVPGATPSAGTERLGWPEGMAVPESTRAEGW